MNNADTPAFFFSDVQTGLTKRELFAAMAFQTILATRFRLYEIADVPRSATEAVMAADALLAELERKVGG